MYVNCPRCGLKKLRKDGFNKISRRVKIQICTSCGSEEAWIDEGIIPKTDLRELAFLATYCSKGKKTNAGRV